MKHISHTLNIARLNSTAQIFKTFIQRLMVSIIYWYITHTLITSARKRQHVNLFCTQRQLMGVRFISDSLQQQWCFIKNPSCPFLLSWISALPPLQPHKQNNSSIAATAGISTGRRLCFSERKLEPGLFNYRWFLLPRRCAWPKWTIIALATLSALRRRKLHLRIAA